VLFSPLLEHLAPTSWKTKPIPQDVRYERLLELIERHWQAKQN